MIERERREIRRSSGSGENGKRQENNAILLHYSPASSYDKRRYF